LNISQDFKTSVEILKCIQCLFIIKDYHWIASSIHKTLPYNGCGSDTDGDLIYVGRFSHANDTLPAKIIPAKRRGYAAYCGKEILARSYEVHML
jgi:hypothetical protein